MLRNACNNYTRHGDPVHQKGGKGKNHCALLKGSKIKEAIAKASHPDKSDFVHLCTKSDRWNHPMRFETDPHKMGTMISNSLSCLGGHLEFQVDE